MAHGDIHLTKMIDVLNTPHLSGFIRKIPDRQSRNTVDVLGTCAVLRARSYPDLV
jgi:hypothetical protein